MAIIPMTKDAKASVITVYDPAIDHDKSETRNAPDSEVMVLSYFWERFKDPTGWRDSVKFKDGQRPTVFSIGVIPPAQLTQIEDECGVGKGDKMRVREINWRAFLAGVRDIENGPTTTIKKDGRDVQGVPKVSVGGIEYVDPQWLSDTFVRGLREIAIDIGMVCYRWNQMQDDDVKN